VPFRSPGQPLNGRHLIFGTLVFSTSDDGTIVGQSNIDGATLWKYDPAATLGPDGGALAATSLMIWDVALSNQGIFYYTGTWASSDGTINRVIGGILRNGQARFQKILPPQGQGTFGYPLLVDEHENLYTSAFNESLQDFEVESFDELGTSRWTLPVNSGASIVLLKSFSENSGLFVEPNPLMAFDSSGNLVWSHGVVDPNDDAAHSPVVASDGTTSVLQEVAGVGSLVAFKGSDGTPLWNFPLPNNEAVGTSHVLDSAGRLYFLGGDMVMIGYDRYTINSVLYVMNDADGQVLLSSPLDPALKISVGVLGLTPAGSLIASARQQLTGIFAGAPMAASPWPRFRGDNRNRSCPTPANTPILPP
jgi:outer membrane protein assembly factor BamB